jgi:hypothetical protein
MNLVADEYLDSFPDVTREQAVAVLEYAHKWTFQSAACRDTSMLVWRVHCASFCPTIGSMRCEYSSASHRVPGQTHLNSAAGFLERERLRGNSKQESGENSRNQGIARTPNRSSGIRGNGIGKRKPLAIVTPPRNSADSPPASCEQMMVMVITAICCLSENGCKCLSIKIKAGRGRDLKHVLTAKKGFF